MFNIRAKQDDNSLITGWIGEILCLVSIDTEASVTIVRLNITAGLPKRDPIAPYILQMASGKPSPS
jgi:hypothetical protein